MTNAGDRSHGYFGAGGEAYARFRPTYPPALAAALASLAPARELAIEVGCGSGQLTRLLADHVHRVLAFDVSASQIAEAHPHPRIAYAVAAAEAMPAADGVASLIVAAQAAHWFDLPRFYAEARRVAVPEAILALVSYGAPVMDGPVGDRLRQFRTDDLGGHWPPERCHVEAGYAGLHFPFADLGLTFPPLERNWRLADVLGYVGTWSAVGAARLASQGGLVDRFERDMAALWGDPAATRPIRWPLIARAARL